MLTFEQARRAVVEYDRETGYVQEFGTYFVSAVGYEDEGRFVVNRGAREWLEGDDSRYATHDDSLLVIDKDTGEVTEEGFLPGSPEWAAFEAMTEVHDDTVLTLAP